MERHDRREMLDANNDKSIAIIGRQTIITCERATNGQKRFVRFKLIRRRQRSQCLSRHTAST